MRLRVRGARRSRLVAVPIVLAALAFAPQALANTYTVTSTSNSGSGSLADAITQANGNPGPDTIAFDLPGPIAQTLPLPAITEQVTIDGTTQPGYSGSPLVFVNGHNCDNCAHRSGLTFTGGTGSLVQGIAIGNFPGYGIELQNGSSATTVSQSYIGIDAAGTGSAPNADGGIGILGSSGNSVIGDVLGANGSAGSPIDPAQIVISGVGASGNLVQGSRIGLGPAAGQYWPATDGVFVGGAGGGNVIGSTVGPGGLFNIGAAERNTIAAQSGAAVLISGTAGTHVAGNNIGVDANGASTSSNGVGIHVLNSTGSQIGPGNTVQHNSSYGVLIDGTTVQSVGNRVVANSIYANNAYGLFLQDHANRDQPAPVVSAAGTDAAGGTVTGAPGDTVFVEVFKNGTCGLGEDLAGETYLTFAEVTIGSNGKAAWSAGYGTLSAGEGITATSTNAGTSDTSTFSNCAQIPSGTLSGSLSTSGGNVDLTALGAEDWAIWGYAGGGHSTSLAPDVRKSGGTAISALTDINPTSAPLRGLGQFGSQTPFAFSWSNGTSPASANGVYGGLQHDGEPGIETPGETTLGDGFSFTVPADPAPRTLTIYTSAHWASGTLTATLSDGSAGPYSDTVVGPRCDLPSCGNVPGVYTLTYAAASAGQHLTVQLTETADNCSDFRCDNAAIYAVALGGTPAPPPTSPAPNLFLAVPNAGPTGGVGIAGLEQANVPSNTAFDLAFFAGTSCADPEPTALGTKTVTTNADGVAAFAIDSFPAVAAGQVVWATASRGGGPASPRSNCVRVGANNTSWTTASTLGPDGSTTGYLESLGEARWYKVPILPNSRVDIDLSNTPVDSQIVAFSDIQQAYDALGGNAVGSSGGSQQLSLNDVALQQASAPQDAFNTSQYNPSSWDPTNWDPTLNSNILSPSYSPSQWSPSQWSPSQWSPSQWSPSQWSPSQWSPSQWSPSQWSPSQWSPSQWSPSQWSPSQWSPSDPSYPQLFADAQTRSVLAVSTDGHISVNTWNNTGYFYIRIQGKNGAFDPDHPFTLSVKRDGSSCAGVTDTPSTPSAPAGNYRTVVLYDGARLPMNPTLLGKLQTFAARPEVAGALVDVSADPAVATLNAQADANTSCVYAKNLVAGAIKREVDAYRQANPALKYVVVVGGDSVIPFYRYPDPSLLGNETLYSPPVLDASASQAALRLGYILNQDYYGSSSTVLLHGNQFPVPGLAVGRLVETPAEIAGMLDAYSGLANGVVPTPTRSLVTGYDFLQDAADNVESNLAAGLGAGATNDQLITNNGISPGSTTVNNTPDRTHSWTAADLRAKLLGSTRHDLIFLGGHFSANDALAADYQTNILSTDLASATTDFTNSIVFSIGCHSGYNIVNGDAIQNVTGPMDWAEAFATKKATLIAGTGYQYGDTDFLAYSERIYAEFSRQLRVTNTPSTAVPVAVGNALVRAKQAYLQGTPTLSALDEKALLEATVFGLPMLSVNLPSGRIYEAPDSTTISAINPVSGGPGSTLGLRFADTSVGGPGTSQSKQLKNPDGTTGPLATWYTGPNGAVDIAPIQPVLPLFDSNVSSPLAGYLLRGVGFLSGDYTDTGGVTPLTAAPATELRGVHAPFYSDVFFPVQPFSTNYFGALDGGGVTRLDVTPVQHLTDLTDPAKSTRRAFSNMGFRLFYSNELRGPVLAAPPTITGVSTSFDQTTNVLTVSAHILGDANAGIQAAWVTWTIPPGSGSGTGHWASFDLTQDTADPTLWSGQLTLGAGVDPGTVAFLVQAVNGVGRVTFDANVGAFYHPGSIPGEITGTAPPAPTTMALTQYPTAHVQYGDRITVSAKLTDGAGAIANAPVRIALGSTSLPATTGSDGVATVTVPVGVEPGTYDLTATFAGDSTHASSQATTPVTVDARGTSLTITAASVQSFGGTLSVTALLKDRTGALLAQRNVFFLIAGTGPANGTGTVQRTLAAKTDATGVASVPAATLAGLPVGNYSVKAYFNGAPAPFNVAQDDIDYAHAEAQATFAIQWPFTGFLAPVDNPPTINVVKAGSAVPVKFKLGGDRGLSIFLGGYPKVVTVACNAGAPTDPINETTTSTSGLQYDPTSQQYTYVWKTQKGWTGCAQLQLGLVDGSTRYALFQFK